MARIRMNRCAVQVNIDFATPLLDWNGVPTRFFSMIHNALADEIQVSPSDFTAKKGISPGDLEARYRVFGGGSSITLSAKRLSLDFTNLLPTDLELLQKMIKAVDIGFAEEFADLDQRWIHCAFNGHAEIADGSSIADYLNPYRTSSVEAAFQGNGPVIYSQAIRFTTRDEQRKWSLHCLAEQSEALQDGLFLSLDMTLFGLGSNAPFETKLKRILDLVHACSKALRIEWDSDA